MLTVNVDQMPMASFALVHNNVAIIRSITIKNDSDTDLSDLKVKITFDPEFAETVEEHIVSLPTGQVWCKPDIKPFMNTQYLCNLTERIHARTKVCVFSAEGELLAEENKELMVLDYCQYWGNSFLSQYLAAFVTPRHIALDQIIKRASEILGSWTGDKKLTAYLHDVPQRPKMIVGAIYEAIVEQHITYCYPTVTLATHGQKIRTCDELLSAERGKRGCCFDMALLMCSCLEAVGLNPLLIMLDDHAFVGCWLIEDMFADCVNDDPTLLTKRTADGINEIVLIEATGANDGSGISFEQAIACANDRMKDEKKFCFALDVARSRLAGILPVPQRIYNGNEYAVLNDDPVEERHDSPVEVGKVFTFRKDDTDLDRFDLWQRRLLDLSTRNNLLNSRFTKNTLRVMVPSLVELVDLLYKDKEMSVLGRPEDWKSAVNGKNLGERIEEYDPVNKLLSTDMAADRIRSFQGTTELARTLTGLYRSSRLSLEESGANTLYMALGFLKWYEQGTSISHFAPIVLFPVKLERRSANKGYYMTGRDEDPLLNETLFEFLKQNYDIELPDLSNAFDSEGRLDIRFILAAMRNAVMDQDKWDVLEESVVGIFDFNRFVIWNDLRTNRRSMMEHPLVSSMVSGRLDASLVEGGAGGVEDIPSKDVALPISADSSQLAAINDAAAGKCFVLHGPPGTGKSQTITNIISNALFHGKRVLFVAEKMAALEVVQKRLAAVGLAPFCLELHSNKTKKSMVMEQLKRTTEVMQVYSDGSFEKSAEHIDSLKRELNRHVEELHRVHESGLSVYDCFCRYSSIGIGENAIASIPEDYIVALTPDLFDEHTELVGNFASVAAGVAVNGNPLHEINLMEYSPNLRNEISGLAEDICARSATLSSCGKMLFTAIGCASDGLSRSKYDALYNVSKVLLGNEIPSVLVANLGEELLKLLKETVALRESLDNGRRELLAEYNETILELDYVPLRARWIESGNKWVVAKYFGRNGIVKSLSSYSLRGASLDDSAVETLFGKLEAVHKARKEYDELLAHIDGRFGAARELKSADVGQLSFYRDGLATLHAASTMLPCGAEKPFGAVASLGWNTFKEINAKVLEEFVSSYDAVVEKVERLESLAVVSVAADAEDWCGGMSRLLVRWKENISALRVKVAYNVVRGQMSGNGLSTVVELFENGSLQHDYILKSYHKGVYRNCADYYISKEKNLSFFQSMLFEDKIMRFRKLCDEFEGVTCKELVARMSTMLPALRKEASQSSDVGYLQRCIRNGCRSVTIRNLFDTIPDLVSRMCPAMLMSPLSVSQYLSKDFPEFDLVIFDEASQMPTCEAVAAISRGKSVIVVGDEHQLPPTSFFMAENFSEQYSENEDLESILEDCLALSMQQRHLLWHYRSKHESLITFSNRHFYKNSLMTFPSNDDMANRVSFEYVEGVYDRGAGRNNKEEAKAVVDEIKKRLSAPETASRSIGVVTFNVNQQSLIEDMLNEMLRKNPELETVAANMHEPIFVKNLENVQGDERDVILFSVGYGRDQYGRVAMNFGPLNRDGGERRLNVAVSRARYEMKVFSSLRAEDIDLYRSDAKGVAYLKYFLDYAARGKAALMNTEYGYERKLKDAFVESVASTLREKGYTVNTDIGSSGYRVDIGIVNPEMPERYLLGLLCDGHNYVSSNTARDRDVTTPAVLSLLGWKTCRVWSVEWWDAPENVLDGIIREIEKARQTFKESFVREEAVAAQDDDEIIVLEVLDDYECEEEEPPVAPVRSDSRAVEYGITLLPLAFADSARFSQGHYEASVIDAVRIIIESEAPISRRLLVKRLLSGYNIRNSARINAYLEDLFGRLGLVASGTDEVFYWKDREQLENYSGYRSASGREALDIPPEEVAQAVLQVVEDQFAIDEAGLIVETARMFGYASVRDNIAASMKRGIAHAVERQKIFLEGGRYRMNRMK